MKLTTRLNTNDKILLVLLTAGLGLAARVLWSVSSVTAFVVLVVLLAPLVAALQIELYRRTLENIERQISLAQSNAEAAYQQIESLFSIFCTLRIGAPLPPMRGWAISPDFANVIARTIYEKRPRRALELGSGVSTLIAGHALRQAGGGVLISLEHDEQFARISDGNVKKHGLTDVVSVVCAPLRQMVIGGREHLWYDRAAIEGLGEIDLVIVDGPPGTVQDLARYPALPLLWSHLSDQAAVLIDDADRTDERRMIELWCSEFPSLVVERLIAEKGAVILYKNRERESRVPLSA